MLGTSEMAKVELRNGLPRDLDRLVGLQAAYYGAYWDFLPSFGEQVAQEMAAFIRGFQPEADGFWVAGAGGEAVVGGVAIAAAGNAVARLRWFIVDPAWHGRGIGNALLTTATAFCQKAGYRRIVLQTFKGLEAAHALYRRHGFRPEAEECASPWGTRLTFQSFGLEVGNG